MKWWFLSFCKRSVACLTVSVMLLTQGCSSRVRSASSPLFWCENAFPRLFILVTLLENLDFSLQFLRVEPATGMVILVCQEWYSMVVQLLFMTSTMVFAYSTLWLVVCIYRNSAIFVSEEHLVLKFSGRCGVGCSLPEWIARTKRAFRVWRHLSDIWC